jgi:phosphatidylinositol-3-phosphatase
VGRRILIAAALLAAVPAGAAARAAAPAVVPLAATLCTGRAGRPATYAHVVVVVMENHDYGSVIGSSQAPFTNKLAHACGLATAYHAVTHPSLPNYLAITSGSTAGITSDCTLCRSTLPSIFGQAAGHGLGWRAYEEAMPVACDRVSVGRYVVRHNPPLYYTRLRRTCAGSDVPAGTLAAGRLRGALLRNTLPGYAFVTPDMCHDTHDCPVAAGDAWLQTFFGLVARNHAYRAGRVAVFVVWDEGVTGNHVPAIAVSPFVPPGTRSAARLGHYSLLRTSEMLLGLPLLGHASAALGMRRLGV